jgi:cytochrome c-type biogenesis protein CcmF
MHYGSNLLVALGEDLGAGKWSVRIQMRPLVNLVWLAAFIMAVGGGIALSDRRYRSGKTAENAATDAIPGQANTVLGASTVTQGSANAIAGAAGTPGGAGARSR